MRIRILIAFLLLIVLLLPGCSSHRTDITREEIVAAYEAAGYSVWTDTYDEKLDHGEIAYVQANHPDGDYIYFSIPFNKALFFRVFHLYLRQLQIFA